MGGPKATGDPAQPLRHFEQDQLQPLGVHQVGLGHHGDPDRHTQMLQHGEVLRGLGHDALVRRDDQQRHVDARRAGHHGAHEVLVPRHVHNARYPAGAKLQRREVEIDGDAPAPLLDEPVHRASGERGDQGRLPVVDVPRRPDDHAAFQGRVSQNSRAGSSAPSARW